MVARLRIVLFAVAVLALARVAYAQNIHIEIQGDPWKASQMEARKQYLRGREADEMIRKGYVCYRWPGDRDCTWDKPPRDSTPTPTARWGKCVKSTAPVKGRMCERKSPYSSGFSYFDFERPLVLLAEKRYEAQSAHPLHPEDPDPIVDALRAKMWTKAHDILKRLPAEQVEVVRDRLSFSFGYDLHAAFVKVDPEGWAAAQAKEAAEAAKPALTPDETAAKAKAAEAKPAPLPVDESAESRWPPLAPGKSGVQGAHLNLKAKAASTYDATPVEATAPDESAANAEKARRDGWRF